MPPIASVSKKRKANARDSPEAEEVLLSGSSENGSAEFADSGSEGSPLFDEEPNIWESDLEDDESVNDFEADIPKGLADETPPVSNGKGLGPTSTEPASEEDEDEEPSARYTIIKDANGNERYIYDDIQAGYASDDSDAPLHANTIGNIPLSFYDSYPHIGYDINGKKISRPAKGEALDALLDSIDVPRGWTGLTDPETGKPLELSLEELDILKRVQLNEVPEENYDPYPATIEYFTSKTEIMPLSAAPEPKRRFIPSKHETKRVMKLVKAIKEGRIMPYKPLKEEEEEDTDIKRYDIWANEVPRPENSMHIPAPKLPPPGYEESYHPPPEYLPDREETKAWEEADEEDRDRDFLPLDHDALRKVPGYDRFVKEKFERCLDLYLAPRVRRNKMNIDPESLLPKLPSPEELKPFPSSCGKIFQGHRGRVRSVAIDPTGQYLATGGDDGTVRTWEISTGQHLLHFKLGAEPVNVVRWRPGAQGNILCAAVGHELLFIVSPIEKNEDEVVGRDIIDAGFGYAASNSSTQKNEAAATWSRPSPKLLQIGVQLKISLSRQAPIKTVAWHRYGDHFSTTAPAAQSNAVAIHTLPKHLTQLPLRRLKGLVQATQFSPTKPWFLVATQRNIRIYDLSKQALLKILQPGARYISSFDIHPLGDNLIVGSYDKRLLWHDLDLDSKPYKTLRYHQKAIRSVAFHKGGLPLFADASDDGSVQIFHGKVVGDLMENASIVPLKVLRGHKVVDGLGVLEVEWHPIHPWCVTAGGDGTARLWN